MSNKLFINGYDPVDFMANGSPILEIYANGVLVWSKQTTTTTTTTIPPIAFSITSICNGSTGSITIGNFTGGGGTYQANVTPQTSIPNAFSGSFWDVSYSQTYTSISSGTWYIVVRDKYDTNHATYHSIEVCGAGYYDCGYGCQYYSYYPGCTSCTP